MHRIPLLLLATVFLAACAPDSSNATPIGVELGNDHVILSTTEIGAGGVVFEIENRSSDLVHEVEVFGGAVDGALLPVSNSVADTTGLTLIDEVEDLTPGARATLSMNLEPGTYLVLCNLPGHYGNGMWAYLAVVETAARAHTLS